MSNSVTKPMPSWAANVDDQALLIKGKEPLVLVDEEEVVQVIFRASDLSAPFRLFVAEESDGGHILSLDYL